MVCLENGTYRYATYIRFHGSFPTSAAARNGYGLNHNYTMTAEGKEKYGNYYYNLMINQPIDYGIDWLNQHTKERTLIVYSKDIDKDIDRLNKGAAMIDKRFNESGQYVVFYNAQNVEMTVHTCIDHPKDCRKSSLHSCPTWLDLKTAFFAF